jgi:hypothetical protein
MKINDENLFVFKSTGRNFSTHGMDGISITEDGVVRYGYDGYVELKDDEGCDDNDLEFTEEEKKELAVYMIEKWSKFGGLSNSC